MKHRKLFPALVTNQSLACPDLCNSDCPYDCYPYADTYSLPPPIPQPLLHPPPPLETTHRNISPYIIIASTFLGITLLLIIYYLIFIRNCFRRYSNDQDDSDTDSSNDIRLPARIDHPIWHIRTVGLQPSMINSITVFNFKKGDKLIEGTDCSICLNEFQEGELLRLLPKCNHAFHIPCIDTWLRSHTNCPVCRAVIVVSLAPTTFPSTAQNSVVPLEITETSRPGSSHNSETQETTDVQPENSPPLEIQDFNVNEEKLVKRCVSADSFPVSMSKMDRTNFHVNNEYQKSPCNHRSDICSTSRIHQRINDAATESPSSFTDLRVKRSFSYGGRSFLSRHPQNSNLVLPL